MLRTTIAYFVALSHSHADGYILNAVDAAMPMFGMAYLASFAALLKFLGPLWIGQGKTPNFIALALSGWVLALLVGVTGMVFTTAYDTGIAVSFAQPACAFAHSEPCFKVYEDIFNSGQVQKVFGQAFRWAAAIEAVLMVSRPDLARLAIRC